MAVQSTLGTLGVSRAPWGSFAGKVEAIPEKGLGPFTQLVPVGVPWSRYGSFSGKVEAAPEAGGSLVVHMRRRRGRR